MAINEKMIKVCAKSIVRTCNLSKDDGVIVEGGAHALALLEEIALECYKKQATPTIVISSDRYAKRVFDEIPASNLAMIPKQYVGMVESCDMLISIEELEDPRIAKDFPRAKLQARQKAMLPVHDLIMHPRKGKKWLYAGWPTRQAAKSYGVSFDEFEEIVIGGIAASPDALMKLGRKLDRRFEDASWVHVWDDKGTDFRVKIDGRRRNIDDAFISKSDYAAGDRGANLPAGELFIAPHENTGSGTLYCPVTSDRMTDQIVKDVRLEFKNGRLLLDRTTAGKNQDALMSSFKECEEIDRGKFDPVRTRNVAELGIGYNPRIRKAIGYILTDEKVGGTVHLAFGANNTYGGTSDSVMHWDFVSAPGINIEVERQNGRIVPVMLKGRPV